MADNDTTVLDANVAWGRVFELMREEIPSIPTEVDEHEKMDQCATTYRELVRMHGDAGFFKAAWLALTGDDGVLARHETCQKEWDRLFGIGSLARALARYGVAKADETDVGHVTEDELALAKSYAVTSLTYYFIDLEPRLKAHKAGETPPLLKSADEINEEAKDIALENWLTENNPDYLP